MADSSEGDVNVVVDAATEISSLKQQLAESKTKLDEVTQKWQESQTRAEEVRAATLVENLTKTVERLEAKILSTQVAMSQERPRRAETGENRRKTVERRQSQKSQLLPPKNAEESREAKTLTPPARKRF